MQPVKTAGFKKQLLCTQVHFTALLYSTDTQTLEQVHPRGQQPAVSQKAVVGTSHNRLAFRVILMKNCTLESNFVELP